MNIKQGLKRLWVVATIFWYSFCGFLVLRDYRNDTTYWDDPMYYTSRPPEVLFILFIVTPIVFWTLLYMGFWVSSGFSSDKKKDETNE